jgi:cell division protein FtsN
MIKNQNLQEPKRTLRSDQGNTLVGMVIGLVMGLGIALAAAYFIEKNPPTEKPNMRPPQIPLIPKVNSDGTVTNEARDPNSPLQNKPKPADNPLDSSTIPSATDTSAAPTPPSTPPVTETKPSTIYWLQVGAFNDRSKAEANKAQLAMQGMQVKISESKGDNGSTWRVRLGPYSNLQEMDEDKNNLDNEGISYSVIKANK